MRPARGDCAHQRCRERLTDFAKPLDTNSTPEEMRVGGAATRCPSCCSQRIADSTAAMRPVQRRAPHSPPAPARPSRESLQRHHRYAGDMPHAARQPPSPDGRSRCGPRRAPRAARWRLARAGRLAAAPIGGRRVGPEVAPRPCRDTAGLAIESGRRRDAAAPGISHSRSADEATGEPRIAAVEDGAHRMATTRAPRKRLVDALSREGSRANAASPTRHRPGSAPAMPRRACAGRATQRPAGVAPRDARASPWNLRRGRTNQSPGRTARGATPACTRGHAPAQSRPPAPAALGRMDVGRRAGRRGAVMPPERQQQRSAALRAASSARVDDERRRERRARAQAHPPPTRATCTAKALAAVDRMRGKLGAGSPRIGAQCRGQQPPFDQPFAARDGAAVAPPPLARTPPRASPRPRRCLPPRAASGCGPRSPPAAARRAHRTSATRAPAAASRRATTAPAGPAPSTRTSARTVTRALPRSD